MSPCVSLHGLFPWCKAFMDWPRQIRGLLTCYRCILSTPPYDKDHLLIACLYNFLSRVLFEGKRSLFLSLHVWQSLAFSKNQQIALKTNHYSGTPQRKIKQDEDRSKSLCKALPALFSGLETMAYTKGDPRWLQLRGRLDHLRNKGVDSIVLKSSFSPLASFLLFLPRISIRCQIFVSECSWCLSDLGQGLADCL